MALSMLGGPLPWDISHLSLQKPILQHSHEISLPQDELSYNLSDDDRLENFLINVPKLTENFDNSLANLTDFSATHIEKSPTKIRPYNNKFILGRRSNSEAVGRNGVFHWGVLSEGRTDEASERRQDDGVVLLVGLFNLFAVVVYAAQQFLTGSVRGEDKRIIHWQVQKVLDELVLRVHSSDTAANLLSRALKSSIGEPSARGWQNKDFFSTIVLKLVQEKDPQKLKTWLNKSKEQLLKELSSPKNLNGPRLDPKVYVPLKKLYDKVTEQSRQGRAFSSSALNEATTVARTVSSMSFKDIQNVFRTLTELGRIQTQYNVTQILHGLIPPPNVVKEDTIETTYSFPKPSLMKRSKRSNSRTRNRSFFKRNVEQRKNSRYPRFSKTPAQERPEINKDSEESQDVKLDSRNHLPAKLTTRKGIVESINRSPSFPNWADGWFSLITEASPMALDLTTIYSRARVQPVCLRNLLCKSNGYWSKQGTFHAAFVPLLSVLASWAMEDASYQPLGDSLIAVRAGWMGKECNQLYPDCPLTGGLHPVAQQALHFFNTKLRETIQPESMAFKFLSKSGEIDLEPAESRHDEEPTIFSTTTTTPIPTTTTTTASTPKTTIKSLRKDPPPPLQTTEDHRYSTSTVVTPYLVKQYDRYDNPMLAAGGGTDMVPSGSISGMDLQDRPVERSETLATLNPATTSNTRNPTAYEAKQDNLYESKYELNNEHFSSFDKSLQLPNYHDVTDSKHSYEQFHHIFKEPQQLHRSDAWEESEAQSFLHQPGYSSYMALQKPASVKQTNPMSGRTEHERPLFHLATEQKRQKPEKPEKPIKHLKYKYGLRRGLPAGNVDGHSPLADSVNELYNPSKYIPKKVKSTSSANTTPAMVVTTLSTPAKNPLDGKLVSQFGPEDAVTDLFKNELLYQYIRDRQMRNIPLSLVKRGRFVRKNRPKR